MADEAPNTGIVLDEPAAIIVQKSANMPTPRLFGRKKIFTDYEAIDETNIIQVLELSLLEHWLNAVDCEYLYNYKKEKHK